MTVGIKSAGVDLDSIFAMYQSGQTHAANTGIRYGSGTNDLSERYSKLSYGTAASATGIKSAGTDLNAIFAKLGTVIVPITLYPTNTHDTLLTTACQLIITTPGTEKYSTAPVDESDTRMGYGQLYSQSQVFGWPQYGSAPSPNGQGWIWDSTYLEGLTLASGSWTPTITLEFSAIAEAIITDIYYRIYKRSSGGAYTPIVACKNAAITLNYDTKKTISTGWSDNTSSTVTFGTGDKLYTDLIIDITSNSASGYDYLYNFFNLSTDAKLITPGYLQ